MKICYIKLINKEKKKDIFVLSALILALLTLIGTTARAANAVLVSASGDIHTYAQTVIIDPGHGGEDPGAIGVNGALEKDLNLSIAKIVGKALAENGFNVIYTREDDRLLYKPEENVKGIRKISDLKNRCAIGNNSPDAIFVSIHMNSFGSEKYSGTEVYYSKNNPESKMLAQTVQNSVSLSLQPNNKRAVKEGGKVYLLENLNTTAILIECGFLTNKEECSRLCEKEYQKNLSFAIVCGIIEYVETKNHTED